MDTTVQWPQEIVLKPMEEIVVVQNTTKCSSKSIIISTTPSSSSSSSLERKVQRPHHHHKEQAILNCPRCNSTNTKFCYYNNYSLSQPRYFCKTCRRYWTEGGTLRNIPVGGGSRKNKRSSPSSPSPSPASSSKNSIKLPPDHHHLLSSSTDQNPKIHDHVHQGHDLNLGFPSSTHHHDFKTISDLIRVPNFEDNNSKNQFNSSSCSANDHHLSALELLTGISSTTSRGLMSSFMAMPPISDPNTLYPSGFSLPDPFRPPSRLSFSLDGLGINIGSTNPAGYGGVEENSSSAATTTSAGGGGGRLLFPFEDLKQVSNTTTTTGVDDHHHTNTNNKDHPHPHHHQHGSDHSVGYWNGTLAGGSW